MKKVRNESTVGQHRNRNRGPPGAQPPSSYSPVKTLIAVTQWSPAHHRYGLFTEERVLHHTQLSSGFEYYHGLRASHDV